MTEIYKNMVREGRSALRIKLIINNIIINGSLNKMGSQGLKIFQGKTYNNNFREYSSGGIRKLK